MNKLFKYFKPYSGLFAFLIVFTIGQVMASLSLPDYMANIVNHGIVGQDKNVVYHYGLIMLLVALGGGLCTVKGLQARQAAAEKTRHHRAAVSTSLRARNAPPDGARQHPRAMKSWPDRRSKPCCRRRA